MAITRPIYQAERIKLSQIREQMKLIIETACSDNQISVKPVRVHKLWKLKFDFGKIASMLVPENETLIHSWMIGTASIVPQTSATGDFEFVGGQRVDREINFAVWGFLDAKLKDPATQKSSQELIEEESELIADYFMANRNTLGFDEPKPKGLKKVKPFVIENIDTHSFSEGVDVQVAQCSIRVVLAR